MEQHELIVALKNLALELGKTPSRDEFSKHVRNGHNLVKKHFETYSKFLVAAGLEPLRIRATNKIFDADIQKHLDQYQPRVITPQDAYPTIASISDIHWPFENPIVVNRFLEYVGDVKPQYVFLNGDAWDMYSHAKFPRSHNQFTPKEEEEISRSKNAEFWIEIQKRSLLSKCVQMLGNHDVRPLKRTIETMPAMEHWIEKYFTELFSYPNVHLVRDPREEYMLPGNIAVFHGYRTQLGAHRDYTHYNCINGHTHRGGVVFKRIRGQTLWELNSGLAGDPEAKGLTYTAQKITEWTPGFGAVDHFGPRFISV